MVFMCDFCEQLLVTLFNRYLPIDYGNLSNFNQMDYFR